MLMMWKILQRLGYTFAKIFWGVLEAWCLRPELGFFPKLSEGLELLKLGQEQLHSLDSILKGGERRLKQNGAEDLIADEAKRIENSSVYISKDLFNLIVEVSPKLIGTKTELS